MMLPGGSANKLGNRYEKWWTVSEFIRMLHGSTMAVRIEAPGVEKAEFVVTVDSRREFHQVKRSHPSGKWSLAALRADGLLRGIGKQLADNDDRFVFASGSEARELLELCEAASSAESADEFEHSFLAAKDRKARLERLLGDWACDLPTAIERLGRIEVHTIGERDLEQKVRWGVRALFMADPENVLAELRAIAEDSVLRTITHQELVQQLAKRGYRLRHLTRPEHARVAVASATDRHVAGARRRLIQGTLVPRAAAETLLSRVAYTTATDSVMTGKAGAGKTACVVELVDRLRARETPVLAFRLDRVLSASTTTDLGRELGLEESPALVLVAAAEAAGRPGVLIVDQLDAVSTMSGRNSGALDLVEDLLHEARGARMRAILHTVVVCRAFDWKNDSRLRRLMPEEHAQVDVTEFPIEEVNTALTNAGFDAGLFRNRQLELVRLPQNLSLLLDAGFDTARTPAFDTATELFGRYWSEKQQSVTERVVPAPVQWMEVMEHLCDRMTLTQELSVPRETLDKVPATYLDQLTSEGVLSFDGRRYGFGHESFFDYCFARVFVGRSESLVSFLKGSEQHLFRRAQVRQVLAYLRDSEPERYGQELAALLADDGIRMHLKDLAFALLAEVTSPTDEEWMIWEGWIGPEVEAIEAGATNLDRLSALAWRWFFGSPSWFREADQRGLIKAWLTSGIDRLVDTAIDYLSFHQRHSPDSVAALLEPYADHGGEWPQRLRNLMDRASHHTSRRFFDLLLRLVDSGTLDVVSRSTVTNNTLWLMLYDLCEKRPEWVPEVLAHRMRRRFAVIRAAGEDLDLIELIDYDESAARMFVKSSASAPAEFVEHVLPAVLDISDAALIDDQPPKYDAVWPILMKADHPAAMEACLTGLADALAALANSAAATLRDVIPELRRRDTHLANHLLLALYRGGAARYADEAVSLLCDEPWRFECGFSDSPKWCAMELIRAVVPRCSAGNRQELETAILQYVSPLERTSSGYKIGRSSFDLLSAIPVALRSSRGNACYRELARKFGEPAHEPRPITAGMVVSPIAESAADKMTDDQWLRAIEKYHAEHRMSAASDPLKGGALELARVLETRVKEEPDRFARLSMTLPAHANHVYLEHTLRGLKSAAVDRDLKLQVCRKAFAESREHCGKSMADLLGSIEDLLPDDAVQMLHWLATEHEDPAKEAWQEDAGNGQTYYNGDIHMNGINTTRGRAADAVRDLILTDPANIDRFGPTLDRMSRDRSAAVLSCVAGTLGAVAYHDRALGMRLFGSMNLTEERLLATHHVREFIRSGLRDSFPVLRPIVERMLRSSEPAVRKAGACLMSIAALQHESATHLVDQAAQGDSAQRLGVARVAAANIANPECRAWCEAKLVALFNDCDVEVRSEAASCFSYLENQELGTYCDLIAAFCDSRASAGSTFWLLHTLESSLETLPGMTCEVCESILDRLAEARAVPSAPNDGGFDDINTVAKLAFRTYQQHQNDDWASRSLALIDRLCLEGIPDTGAEFEHFER